MATDNYQLRKEERRKRWAAQQAKSFDLSEEGRQRAKDWFEEKERDLRKLSRQHILVFFIPATILLFFPSNIYEISQTSLFLLGAVWGIGVRGHYLDTSSYKDFQKAKRWYARHYGRYDK